MAKGEGQAKLIEPAVSGVEHVLAAVNAAGSVRAVVLTSSFAAIVGDNWERGREHSYTEADWDESATDTWLPYARSKTLAERRAWELHAAQPGAEGAPRRWRLVALQPGFVVGPPQGGGQQSQLVQFAAELMLGKHWPAMPNLQFPFVDLDDVAAAVSSRCCCGQHWAGSGAAVCNAVV